MHERDAILQLFQTCEQAVLATVVEVKGSAYRRAGARMLMAPDGRRAGVINGGCLDADLQLRAEEVLETGMPQLAIYDSTAPEDIIFGLGLGCRGVVKILLQPAGDLDFLRVPDGEKVIVATVFERGSSDEPTVGARAVWRQVHAGEMVLEQNGLSADEFLPQMEEDARQASHDGRSFCRDYGDGTESVRVFVELLTPAQPLLIFGAGADAVPLAALGKLVGWNVQVVDLRAPSPGREAFVKSTYLAPRQLADGLTVPEGAACVIMTHNFLNDLELLKKLLPSPAAYIGILGPRRRTEELLEKIGGDTILPGITPTGEQLDRLFAPIGLDLGTETPEEIALAIIAEIQKTKWGKTGQSLRERGVIH